MNFGELRKQLALQAQGTTLNLLGRIMVCYLSVETYTCLGASDILLDEGCGGLLQ